MEKTVDFHYNKAKYFGDSGETFERFYDSFDRFRKDGEYDKDGFLALRDHHMD